MQSAREERRRGHWQAQRGALCLLLTGFATQGCGTLGIDLDPRDFDLGESDGSSGGRDSSGGTTGAGAETSSGGDSSDASGGEENLGGAEATGGDEGDGGWGNGDGGWANGDGGRNNGDGGWGNGDGGWGNGDGGWANGDGGGSDVGGSGSGGDSSSGGSGGGGSGSGGATAEAACSSGTFGTLTMIDTLGVTGDKWGPTITGDRLTLYFALGTTNTEKIYRSTRTTKDQPFGAAVEVTELNAIARQGTPFVNYDDTVIYFFRQTTSDQTTRNLWYATRASTADPFANLTALTALNSAYREHLPWLTKDELTIYFTSARATSNWETDIWKATRATTSGTFSNLSLVTDTDGGGSEDQSPSLSPDGLTLYFTTDRLTSLDVYSATRATTSDDFGTATREDGLSSSSDDTNLTLSADGREIFLSSARGAGQDLWVATRDCD